jgi:O-antigen/teichoic acid export membrane protein
VRPSTRFSFADLPFKLWHSPTITTWGSFAARTLSLVAVFPLVLARFSAEQVVVWSLLSSIIGLQMLADLGFGSTFSRVIAYAMGGSNNLVDFRNPKRVHGGGKPDWEVIGRICSTMGTVYGRLTVVSVIALASFGTWSLIKPIDALPERTEAWLAWAVVLATTAITFRGNAYSAYLQGINQIALLRRWEIATSLGAVVTSTTVLFAGGGLLGLVAANQIWLVIATVRNRWLCGAVEQGRFFSQCGQGFDRPIFQAVWPSAWRSGVGIALTSGLIQASNLLYAQWGPVQQVASYLIALRLIQAVSQFSQAPFYSKTPLLARLHSEGKLDEQVRVARRGMLLSYWAYGLGFVTIGLGAAPLLALIGSRTPFVDPLLWVLMGIAFFCERYGAMHLQLYTTTNHIIWHIVTLVHGIIFAAVTVCAFGVLGVYALPVGLLAGYLGFFSWYCAAHSYRAFRLRFWSFEKATSLAPLAFILVYCLGAVWLPVIHKS